MKNPFKGIFAAAKKGSIPKPGVDLVARPTIWDKYPTHYPGLTPQTLASILRSADTGDVSRQAELFEEFEEKDDQIFSELQKRKLATARLNWEITPASEAPEDLRIKEFVDRALEGIENWEGAMTYDPDKGTWAKGGLVDVLDAIGKGYSCNEIEWEVSEGQAIPRRFHYVHPRRFTFFYSDDRLAPRLLTQEEPTKGIELPAFKFIFHVHPAKSGLPSRASLLRPLAHLYLFKHYGVKDWAIFIEAYGQPLRIGKYPGTASENDKKVLMEALQALGAEAAMIIPEDMLVEIVKADVKTSSDVYEQFIRRIDRAISKVILGSTLGTEEGKTGSLSLGRVHEGVTQGLVEADCELLSTTLRTQLLRPIVWFNFGRDAAVPRIKFKYEIEEDLNKRMERDDRAVRAGVPIGVRYFRETYGYPEPKEGEEIVSPIIGGIGPLPASTASLGQKNGCKCGCDASPLTPPWPPLIGGRGDGGVCTAGTKKKISRSLAYAGLSGLKADS